MKPSLDYDGENDFIFFYDEANNVMIDCDGYVVANIFEFVNPNMLFLFKLYKEDMLVRNKFGQHIELIWPEHEEN